MAQNDDRSTGRSLFDSALQGGSRALGTPIVGIRALAAADLIALDSNHDALADRLGDAVLDGWIFTARLPAIDCVWRYGRKVVSGGRHVLRERIASRYLASTRRLAGNATGS
jgi:formimidoylglutamate deiminase